MEIHRRASEDNVRRDLTAAATESEEIVLEFGWIWGFIVVHTS